MQRRIAVKRLTASDLTLFEWQFRNRNAGNQKSINLNANVFVENLFPSLPEVASETNGRLPLDLYIYGPGHAGVHNLQRKILKGTAYKNWRLDGEYIINPEDDPERYNVLEPGDLAVFDFQGRVAPTSAKLVLISQTLASDRFIHAELSTILGGQSMVAVMPGQLQAIVDRLRDDEHPFHELTLDAELEDAAQGGVRGATSLRRRAATRVLTADELQRARRLAEEVGRAGEELVCQHLIGLKAAGAIRDFIWTSDTNAVAPYDFLIILPDNSEVAIDVKTTRGEFERTIHISGAELIEMNGARRYDIYRVFDILENSGNLRVAQDVRTFAARILNGLNNLPVGVRVDSVSVDTTTLTFGPPLHLVSAIEEAEQA